MEVRGGARKHLGLLEGDIVYHLHRSQRGDVGNLSQKCLCSTLPMSSSAVMVPNLRWFKGPRRGDSYASTQRP